MRTRLRRTSMVAAALVLAIDARPIAASAAGTSTVGWVRLAQLSPTMASVDGDLSGASGAAQPVMAHAAYGTMSQYQAVAPGGYTASFREAGSSATATTQLTVAAGQAYTVAAFGTAAAKLQVLNDALTAPAGKASVRVIEASRLSPTASVMLGTEPLAANLRSPGASPYQTVNPGTGALLVTTKAAITQTVSASLIANSTYSVVILDGTEDTARVLVVGDAIGMGTMPKGSVATGFGGTAVARHDYALEFSLLAAMLVLIATRELRRRRRSG
ncbi:MAG TPA: DUF4397 domain-containing protein [Actinocrinis sp.]|nr:DUF4397 domain-containing protein [Actinocrinis sp.]